MSRILKRPMFRRGGKVNEGIMSGLVDRTKHAENPFVTTVGQTASKLTPELEAILEQYTPKTRLPIGEFGLDIATGTPILDALKTRYGQFTKKDDAREAAIKGSAAKLAIGQALKTPKDKRTSLMKELEAAGLDPNSDEYKRAILLRTLKNPGTVALSQFGQQANVDKSLKAGDYASESIDFLTSVAEIGARSPQSFGLKGKFLGFGKDIATEAEGLFDSSLRSAAQEYGIEAGVYDSIKNPDFSKIQPLENALSIRLARTRNPQDRLMKDMIRDAKDDTELSGLGGATKVKDRLPTIFKEFLDTARNRYKAAGKTDNEIAAILNPKIKKFNESMAKLAGASVTETEGDMPADDDFKMPIKGEDGVFRF
jgi:hypothetical protein